MTVPMTLRKTPFGREIVTADRTDGALPAATPQAHIALALARAHHGQAMLESGRYGTLTKLADDLRLDRAYIRRTRTLTSLAPDITEALLRGTAPSELTLETLMGDLPSNWDAQRRLLGLASRSSPFARRPV